HPPRGSARTRSSTKSRPPASSKPPASPFSTTAYPKAGTCCRCSASASRPGIKPSRQRYASVKNSGTYFHDSRGRKRHHAIGCQEIRHRAPFQEICGGFHRVCSVHFATYFEAELFEPDEAIGENCGLRGSRRNE